MTSFTPEKQNYSINNGAEANGGDGVQLITYSPTVADSPNLVKRNGNANESGTVEERERFIHRNASPVKLDPGLDSLDRGTELLLIETKADVAQPPRDKFRIVFYIFLIHGVGILMPWNMFITAKGYFVSYKLNTPISENAVYRTEFMFYLGIVSQVSNAVISCVNTFFQFGQQASTRRIAIALFMMVVIFIFTVVLAMVDTSQWPAAFFALTMISASLLNCFTGVYQNSVFGQAAVLPMKYTNAIVVGTNLSGIFTSVIALISIAASPNPRTAAVYYFIVAIVVLLIAFDAYFVLPLTKFYRHYYDTVVSKAPVQEKSKMQYADYVVALKSSCRTYWIVVKKIWLQLFGVWFTFCVSLILFPAIQSDIQMVKTFDPDTNVTATQIFSPTFEKTGYWVTIFCFLSFSLFACLGNITSSLVRWPGPKHVWIPIVLRGVILIPVYIMCNYQPTGVERIFPVLIKSDTVFIIAGIVMAFTSGYYSSLTMMYGPKQVEPEMAGRAGMMMAFFLVLGITCGVNFSLVLQKIITNPLTA